MKLYSRTRFVGKLFIEKLEKRLQIIFLKKDSSILWVIYSILLFLPEPLIIEAPGIRGYVGSWVFNFLFGISIAWILCIIGEFLRCFHKSIFCVWHIFIQLLLCTFTASDLFLIKVFNLRWNAFTFQLLAETTKNETIGFFKTYFFTWQFGIAVIGIVLFLLLEVIVFRIVKNRDIVLPKCISISKKIIIVLSLSLLIYEGKCFTFNADKNHSASDKLLRRDSLWNLYQSILIYSKQKDYLKICNDSQNNLRINASSYLSKNIVLVIGETYNRHHSSLYGYELNTSPRCKALNGYVFDDVVSPINATSNVLKYTLSFSESDSDSLKWYATPLFPALFKKVGYNVCFFSNQYVMEGNLDYFDSSAGFFNHPSIYSKLFSQRNHQRYSFDMDMIDEIRRKQVEISDSLNLFIIHLLGQHTPAVERYPKEFAVFKGSDINRPELSMSERQYIAEYDNATLYNDLVISEIVKMFQDQDAIVIYFADHGEEVYDCRDKAGRSFDFETGGEGVIRNQLDVPFIVFPSTKYKETHPDIVSAIDFSRHRPFMTDNLPHLMLWLAGIDSEWYEESKNLFSPQYNCSRKRIIAGTSIDYNEVINTNDKEE